MQFPLTQGEFVAEPENPIHAGGLEKKQEEAG